MFRLARFLPCPPIRFLFPPDGNVCPILSLFVVLLALSPEGKANHLAVHRHYKPHWSCKWLLQQSLLVRIWLATLSPWVFFCCPTINLCLFLRESSKLFAVINGIIVYCEGQHTALSLNLHCSVHIQGVPWTTFLLCGCFWFAGLEVLTAVLLKIRVFWAVTLCWQMNSFRSFTVPSFLNRAAWSF